VQLGGNAIDLCRQLLDLTTSLGVSLSFHRRDNDVGQIHIDSVLMNSDRLQ
jgi:hypothetical protein